MRKLQINESGAWRQVLTYEDKRDLDVREHAAALCTVGNPRAKLRIIDADTGDVYLYWDMANSWHKPAFVAQGARS